MSGVPLYMSPLTYTKVIKVMSNQKNQSNKGDSHDLHGLLAIKNTQFKNTQRILKC